MQENTITKKEEKNIKIGFKISDLMTEDKQKLVGVFAWLLQEDRKQNPELYQQRLKK
jgi:hypothetical protein